MSTDWWSAGQRWLEQQAPKEAAAQRRSWIKRGRSAKTFRYSPPDWHRDAVEALGRNDEETFKAIKLAQLGTRGLPPLAKGRATKKSPAQLQREIDQALAHTSHATKRSTSRSAWPSVVGSHDLGTADVRTGDGAYWIVTVPSGYRIDYKPWGPSNEVDLGTVASRQQARAKIVKHAGGASSIKAHATKKGGGRVTDAQIRALRREAASAGDHAQALLCDLALGDVVLDEDTTLESLQITNFISPRDKRRIATMDPDDYRDACARAIEAGRG